MDNNKKIIIILMFLIFIVVIDLTILNNSLNKIKNNGLTSVETISKKINENSEYVYDAKYSFNVSSKEYETDYGIIYNIDDIKLPYININSDDASELNEDLKNLYYSYIDIFNKGTKDKKSHVISSYTYSLNDNVLSILIIEKQSNSIDDINKYYSYNFNIETGNMINDEFIYNYFNYEKKDIENKIQNKIKEIIKLNLSEYKFEENENIDFYVKKTIELYQESNKQIYIDKSKNISIIVDIVFPTGNTSTLITLTS